MNFPPIPFEGELFGKRVPNPFIGGELFEKSSSPTPTSKTFLVCRR
jgi:hypothetical protein